MSADRVIGLYQRYAASFDRDRGRKLLEKPWLDRFLTQLPGSSVLDLGCGHGEPIARYLLHQGCQVTGIDSSPPLIELCRERFPHQDWIISDMRSFDPRRRFDGILAWHSLFHLSHDDQRAMIARFESFAAPRAVLLFTSGPEFGESIGTLEGEPLYHSSLGGDEYRSRLASHGFVVVQHTAEDRECGGATVWLARGIRGTTGGEKRDPEVPANNGPPP